MFILEDGTGVSESNAYVDISYVEKYLMGDRLARFNELSEDDKNATIILATQLVDISYEWEGNRQSLEQGLNFPRTDVELYGFAVECVPIAVKKATAEAVWLSMTEESLFSTDNRDVIRERIEGAVDISYANPKDSLNNSVTRFEILDKILRGLFKKEDNSTGSSVGSAQVVRV